MNSVEQKLTLLCPIKDRPEYSRRFIKYLLHVCCPFEVVISDGSLDSDVSIETELANSHGSNVIYKKYRPDSNWDDYLSKMCDSLENIQTKLEFESLIKLL